MKIVPTETKYLFDLFLFSQIDRDKQAGDDKFMQLSFSQTLCFTKTIKRQD